MPGRLMTALLVTLFCAAPAAAQRSTTHGFALGGSLFAVNLHPEDGEDDTGGGLSIEVGYGFRNGLAIFLNGAGASMTPGEAEDESYTLGEGDLGVRYHFLGEENRWRPFVEAAFSSMHVEFEDVEFLDEERDVTISGPGFTVGGGVSYYLSPSWALGGGLRWTSGSFDEVKVDNVTVELDEGEQYDLRTTRLELRITHFFSGN